MLEAYRQHVAERAALGIPPLPLTPQQTADADRAAQEPARGRGSLPAGPASPTACRRAWTTPPRSRPRFLAAVAHGDAKSPPDLHGQGHRAAGHHARRLQRPAADRPAGRRRGAPPSPPQALKKTLLMFDYFHDVAEQGRQAGNANAKAGDAVLGRRRVVHLAARRCRKTHHRHRLQGARRDQHRRPVARARRLEPPGHPAARPGHAEEHRADAAFEPEEDGKRGPMQVHRRPEEEGPPGRLRRRRGRHRLLAQVAPPTRVLWATGEDIPFVPNKRFGGVMPRRQDRADLLQHAWKTPARCRSRSTCRKLEMGDVDRHPPLRRQDRCKNGEVVAEFKLKTDVLLDEVRAGGRINLIIGRGLTAKAREVLGLPAVHRCSACRSAPADTGKGFTLAQKMVGRACGLPEGQGIRPGTYCEPKMTTVGSQDTTGPMTRDELKDLACLGFSRRPGDAVLLPHRGLPEAGGREDAPRAARLHQQPRRRGAAPGRRRHPLLAQPPAAARHRRHRRRLATPASRSASRFPAGSGLVAFAAATGVMPLDMPESVLVRFKGQMQPGVTLRDLVNAIPYYAIKAGPADRGEEGQEEHLLRPHPRDRGPAGPEGRAGLRAVRRLRRALAPPAARSQLNKEPIIEYLQLATSC
ncbi:MAG: hypothetical protein MZW92_73690 [Comamonadaceae bacterium]|nr:hypothetical protein [Comamonadaceae bacterium]